MSDEKDVAERLTRGWSERSLRARLRPSALRRRWPIAVGVVAAVVIVAGAGFWVWHEQPSFCNAVVPQPHGRLCRGLLRGREP